MNAKHKFALIAASAFMLVGFGVVAFLPLAVVCSFACIDHIVNGDDVNE